MKESAPTLTDRMASLLALRPQMSMTKRQAMHMACYVVIAIEEKVRGVVIHGWTQFFTDVHLFWMTAAAAALAISGVLMKSDGHGETPREAPDVPEMSPSYPPQQGSNCSPG